MLSFSPPQGLATAMPEILNAGPATVAILVIIILAAPHLRRETARLIRAVAYVLDPPVKG